MSNYFHPNPKDDGEDNFVSLTLYMEELLLSYYYFLSKRKVLKIGIMDYWSLDTYTLYTLFSWENKAVKKEKELAKEHEGNQQNHSNTVKREDDPYNVDLYKKYVEDEDDDEDPV
jgi:hypothetical protein